MNGEALFTATPSLSHDSDGSEIKVTSRIVAGQSNGRFDMVCT